MNELLSVILTLGFIFFVATLVIKKYNSVFVFIMSGLSVIMAISLITGNSILGDSSTGSLIVDVFAFIGNAFKSNASGVGLTLMMVTGFAVYMSHIGAATKLAYLATRPLSRIKNSYIVLSLLFIIGTILKMVIPSHSGLAMLLMAIAFPILTSLGISRLSAASTIILTGFVDWGPNDSSAIFAAEQVVGMPMMEYFIKYQGIASVILIAICAVLLPIYLKFQDEKAVAQKETVEITTAQDSDCPALYAIFPVIPLVLVAVFSFIPSIKLNLVEANLIGLVFVFLVELIVKRDRKKITNDFNVVLKAMGNSFASVVSILVGASIFAEGIKLLGGITIISNTLASIQSASIITIALMSLITFLAGTLLGSGNASWYAFGPLVPDVAAKMGISSASIALPMQLSSGIGRCMSPVSAAVIAVAGMAELEIMDIVKRCYVPAVFLFVCNVVVSMFIA